MATCSGGAGCPIDRDINLHIEDTEGINTGLINDDENTSGLNTTVALGGSEAEGHPDELIPSNQAKLAALMSFSPMSTGQRRPTSRKFGLYRKGATKSLPHTTTTTFTYT